MKEDKKRSRSTIVSRLCMAILALLGLAGCDDVMCEYGCPTMDYKIEGTVTNAESVPLEGIRVVLPELEDTVFTDAKGYYCTGEHQACPYPAECGLVFDDVDGDAHGGSFASDSLTYLDVSNAPRTQYKKGDGNWYNGGFLYKVDVKLEEKK